MEKVFHLVYISEACEKICYSDIQSILESSRRQNLKFNITGLLIYKDHHFIQILEGQEEDVMSTLARIIQDRRNHHLKVQIESRSNCRIFDKWAMAFHDGDIDSITSSLVNKLFATALDQENKEKESMLQMLQCFRKSAPSLQI